MYELQILDLKLSYYRYQTNRYEISDLFINPSQVCWSQISYLLV